MQSANVRGFVCLERTSATMLNGREERVTAAATRDDKSADRSVINGDNVANEKKPAKIKALIFGKYLNIANRCKDLTHTQLLLQFCLC